MSVAGLLLMAVVLLIVCLLEDNRYDVKINRRFVDSMNQATTTLTCNFLGWSYFSYTDVEGYDYIRHSAGKDKNGTSVVVTFTNIDSNKPQLVLRAFDADNGSLGDAEQINVLPPKRLSNSVLLIDEGYDSPTFYFVYPSQKIAVMQQSASLGPKGEILSAFSSMGYCH